jgi:hypothetical protein
MEKTTKMVIEYNLNEGTELEPKMNQIPLNITIAPVIGDIIGMDVTFDPGNAHYSFYKVYARQFSTITNTLIIKVKFNH